MNEDTRCTGNSYRNVTGKKPYGPGGFNRCILSIGHTGEHEDSFGNVFMMVPFRVLSHVTPRDAPTKTILEFRVQHIPQVPMKPFTVDCKDLAEAKKIVDVLAEYDLFQFDNNIKPDYSNVSWIESCEADGEWEEVVDDE